MRHGQFHVARKRTASGGDFGGKEEGGYRLRGWHESRGQNTESGKLEYWEIWPESAMADLDAPYEPVWQGEEYDPEDADRAAHAAEAEKVFREFVSGERGKKWVWKPKTAQLIPAPEPTDPENVKHWLESQAATGHFQDVKRAQFLKPTGPKQDLVPGQKVVRLSPSSTGRMIYPGLLGQIGGLNPSDYNNPSRFEPYGYVPIQWQSGLWSNLEADDRGTTWDYYPRPVEDDDE